MAIDKPQLGGVIIDEGTTEAINLLHDNKTAIINKFTANSLSQAPVRDIQKLQDAFDRFNPNIPITHLTADGEEVNESIRFTNLSAFTKNGITEQSNFLRDLRSQEEDFRTISTRLTTNKLLQSMLANPALKAAFVEALEAMVSEIDEAN